MQEVDVRYGLFGFQFQHLHRESGLLEGDFKLLMVTEGGGVGGDEIAEDGDDDDQPDVGERHHGLAFLLETLPGERG